VREVELRDGSRVAIRPIEPDDRDGLRRAFERLSPTSRYRRFFGPMPQLSDRDLVFLTRVDHHDHEALIAVASDGEGVGVARYVRTGDAIAEPAVAVIDDWHGRGVASALLDALSDRAREEGVTVFEAPVLATNAEAIRVLERLGRVTRRNEGREVVLRIALPPEAGRGSRWASVLRQHAAGTLEPARSVVSFLWPRDRGPVNAPRRNVIVVGTDGSAHASAAVQAAGELARFNDAGVVVVGAHRFLAPGQDELREAIGAAADALRSGGLHVHVQLRRGDPALVLADVAAEHSARLIVVGAGERGKATRRVIGGVADLVAERAPCNVLIVRPR
jgi:nucleotide-binding universal stress UspA family protein/GNAT superfamily N-acetyltransferase